jgi:hypothetical protein
LTALAAEFSTPDTVFVWLDFICLPQGSADSKTILELILAAMHAADRRIVLIQSSGEVLQDAWCLSLVWTALSVDQAAVAALRESCSGKALPSRIERALEATGCIWGLEVRQLDAGSKRV